MRLLFADIAIMSGYGHLTNRATTVGQVKINGILATAAAVIAEAL